MHGFIIKRYNKIRSNLANIDFFNKKKFVRYLKVIKLINNIFSETLVWLKCDHKSQWINVAEKNICLVYTSEKKTVTLQSPVWLMKPWGSVNLCHVYLQKQDNAFLGNGFHWI